MAARIGRKLSFSRKLLLAAVGTFAVAIPVVAGLANAPPRYVKLSSVETSSHSLGAVSVRLSVSPKAAPGFGDVAAWGLTPGKLSVKYASLRDLIQRGYLLRGFQIYGGPNWTESHSYEVTANASGNPTIGQWLEAIGPTLQSLLKDRFALRFHFETRELPGYALTIAQGGDGLQSSKRGSCVVISGFYYGETQKPICGLGNQGLTAHLNHTFAVVGMSIMGPSIGPPSLTSFLSAIVGRPVIDKTGLAGRFDFHLEWNLEATERALGHGAPGKVSDDEPSIFNAIQNQLGLKLEPAKGPVKVLVIDRAKRPSL